MKILLTATVASLIGCKEDFPAIYPELVDQKKARVLVHEIVDRKNIKFRAVGWKPISTIDGHYCLSPKDLQSVLNWSRNNLQSVQETE